MRISFVHLKDAMSSTFESMYHHATANACYRDRLLLRVGASAESSTSIGSSCSTLLGLESPSVERENSEAEGPVQAFSLESSPPVSSTLFSSSHNTDRTTPTCPFCHVCDSNQGALGSLKVERVSSATSPSFDPTNMLRSLSRPCEMI